MSNAARPLVSAASDVRIARAQQPRQCHVTTLRYVLVIVAAGCAAINVAAAEDTGAEPTAPVSAFRTDWGIHLGPLTLTPGGFLEFTSLYRQRNETADIGSNLAGIPFANSPNHYIHEYRQTARNSRFSLLVQGPQDSDTRGEGYIETDFLGSGTSSNANESNSYAVRMRQGYLAWSRPGTGWSALGGQAWSLVTLYKHGLTPRQEDIPLGDDGQYYTGFNWARQAQLRVVKTFSPAVAAGLSLENPQVAVSGPVPAGATAANPGTGALNSMATYSTTTAPDVVLKLALDPGFGHFELYSLTRFLHDRAPRIPGVLHSERNQTTVAQSFGGGFIVPLWGQWLDLRASALIGRGNGRYGSAQLGDAEFDTRDGSLAPLREQQGLVGLIAHPSPRWDVFVYAGLEQQTADFALVPTDNTACKVNYVDVASLPKTAQCGGVGRVRELAGGFVWKAYQGNLGYVTVGPEVAYVKDTTFTARNGTSANTSDTMVYFTIRYYP